MSSHRDCFFDSVRGFRLVSINLISVIKNNVDLVNGFRHKSEYSFALSQPDNPLAEAKNKWSEALPTRQPDDTADTLYQPPN